jgi:hypothetical protein
MKRLISSALKIPLLWAEQHNNFDLQVPARCMISSQRPA